MTTSIISQLRCGTCREWKPASDFSKNRSKSRGFNTTCRQCHRTQRLKREGVPKVIPFEKKCSRCKLIKPCEDFRKDNSHSNGLRSRCRDCERRDARDYQKSPGGRARRKEYEQKNRDKVLRGRKHYRENSPAYRAKQQRYMKEYASNEEVRRRVANNALMRVFGITLDQYENLAAAQDNRCAICGKPETGKRLSVDHDHQTGRVRGLLCGLCNTAIGKLNDDPALLEKAVTYLRQHGPDY